MSPDLIGDPSQASEWPLAKSVRERNLFWLLCDVLLGCLLKGAYPLPGSTQRSATVVESVITPLLWTGCFTGGCRQVTSTGFGAS